MRAGLDLGQGSDCQLPRDDQVSSSWFHATVNSGNRENEPMRGGRGR